METYNPREIEGKWQKKWEDADYGIAPDFSDKKKNYHLFEFPYPSGSGLHIGHCMVMTASDAYARMKRAQGENVMLPIGWDSFGLPTENYAIKTGILPQKATEENIANFKKQSIRLGYAFDWSRELATSDPDYYRWTQWIFLQFYKHAVVDPSTGSGQVGKLVEVADDDTTTPRLAYQAEMPINWCPSCKIGLANEEVIAGKCERCGAETEKKMQKQWMLRITAYADRLINDLETVDFPDKVKTQQINWIGRSEGAEVKFEILSTKTETNSNSENQNNKDYLEVFTTRPDTLFGATLMVVAPENDLVEKFKSQITNYKEVEDYIKAAKAKSDIERTDMTKEKTGVELKGIKAINPVNNEEIPIFVADYVLSGYGTGAIMAVPAHDERDYEFAKKYDIPVREVIIPKVIDKHDPPKDGVETIFRHAVQVILTNPKDGKILCLKWKKFPWTTFITGGIEEGEDPVAAAKREVIEETGYKNIKYVKTLGGPVESHFFANHKGVNRKAHFLAMSFELIDEEREEISDEEKAIHELSWVTWDELNQDKNVKCSEYDIWLERINHPEYAFCDNGVMIDSGDFTGMDSEEAQKEITKWLEEKGVGKKAVNYKLRDWIFSRQHYWGEPIPIIYCAECAKNYRKNQISKIKNQNEGIFSIIDGEECMMVPVPEDQLPLELPVVEKYQPTNTGQSPLADVTDWVNTTCPVCGGKAKRETDTMPNWAGSSWYFLAYAMKMQNEKGKTENQRNLFIENKKELDYWMPVDLYNGGMEHTTLHLLYSRFWNKFLYDIKLVPTSEPYKKRIAHGIILGSDGQKMSKSRGNVISPDEIIEKYGADSLRAYIMFIGPYDQESAWNIAGLQGVYRFLNRVWNNIDKVKSDHEDSDTVLIKLNQVIKGVTEDLESFQMNTVISKLMELNNTFEKEKSVSKESFEKFLILLSAPCPHIAEEMWHKIGNESLIVEHEWPKYDEKYLIADKIEIVVQINGKVRDRLSVENNISDEEMEKRAKESEKTQELTAGKEIVKVIVVSKKLVNIVIKG